MTFLSAYNGIIGSLQSLIPVTHYGQPFNPRNINSFKDLDDAVRSGLNRQFELDLIRMTEGPYITNGSVNFQTAELVLTVGYCSGSFRQPEELYSMIAEDFASIIGYLRLPNTWSGYAFELGIIPGNEGQTEVVLNDNNETAGYKQTYLITAEWEN